MEMVIKKYEHGKRIKRDKLSLIARGLRREAGRKPSTWEAHKGKAKVVIRMTGLKQQFL